MKKKLLTMAMAVTMALVAMFSAFAETKDVTIDAAFSANTGDEAVTGDFDVTYTFNNASKDTSANWNNFAVEVFDAAGNYITVRADAFGVGAGTGDYNEVLGTWNEESKMTWTGTPVDEAGWQQFAKDMADADVTVNVKRADKVITFKYDIKAGNNTYNFVGTTPEIPALADDLSVHITGEKVALTNVKFTNNAGTTEATSINEENTTADNEEATTENDENDTTKAEKDTTQEQATDEQESADNEKMSPVVLVVIVVVAVVVIVGIIIATKKKN